MKPAATDQNVTLGSSQLRLIAQSAAELADGLVFLVAHPLGAQAQLGRDLLGGPTFEAKFQDALLPLAQNFSCCQPYGFHDVGATSLAQLATVGNIGEGRGGPLTAALRPLADGVNSPNQFAPLFAIVDQDLVPRLRRNAFQKTAKNLLRAIAP